MGICISVPHGHHHQHEHQTLQRRLSDNSPSSEVGKIQSLDLDLIALCLTNIICRNSATPLLDDMRVKIGKNTSSKGQICPTFSGKRKHETDPETESDHDIVDVVSTVPMENKSLLSVNPTEESKCNEQSTRTLNKKMSTIELCSPPKRTKNETMLISAAELSAFFKLFDDDLIQDFLWMDSCARVADKFLLAMIFTYFKRAKYTPRQYTRMNFFLALYLASDMEEDEEEYKYEIFPWALGKNWRNKYTGFLRKRDKLLRTINYRAAVSRICCEEVMSLYPGHMIWKRERKEHHAGAVREYDETSQDFIPVGPNGTPVQCDLCAKTGSFAYCLASPCESPSCEECIYLSSCSDASTDSVVEVESDDIFEKGSKTFEPGRFDMHGLKSSLQVVPDDSYFWAGRDE